MGWTQQIRPLEKARRGRVNERAALIEWADPALARQMLDPLVPDTTLIRDYDRKLMQVEPFQTPYIAHFHEGDKHLFYVAATHARGPETDTFRQVRAAFEHGRPQLVIIEGLPSADGLSPAFYREYTANMAAEHFEDTEEPAYAAHHAMQAGIPFIGGEPTDKEILSGLQEKGYSEKDMVAFYLLRWIPRWVKYDGVNEQNFDQKAREFLNHMRYYQDHHIPQSQRLTVAEFKEWYEQHNDRPGRSYLQIDSESLAPIRSPQASYFERLSADINEVREQHLDRLIGAAVQKHDRVLVVYGSGHLIQSRNVFEAMLSHGENVQAR